VLGVLGAAFFLTGFTSDLRKDLQAIQVPALANRGAHDVQAPLPLFGQRTAELLPHGELIVMRTRPTACS